MSALRWALHRLGELSWRERWVLSEALISLPAVHAAQQHLPFARWRRLLERDLPGAAARLGSATVEQVAWAVDVASRWLPGDFKCLPRAYTTHLLLRRYGYRSEVHLGVSRDAEGRVEAHAWVECGGSIVVGWVEDMQRFVPLPPLVRGAR